MSVSMLSLRGIPREVRSKPDSQPGSPPAWSADLNTLTGPARALHEGFGLIPLSSAARLFTDPITGRRPSPKSVWRWTQSGCRGIRLKTVRAPYGRCTTEQFVREFLRALAGDAGEHDVRPVADRPQPPAKDLAKTVARQIVNGGRRTGGDQ